MPTPKKEQIVRELEELVQQASSLVFADYRGLKHQELEELRRRLREYKAGLRVVKNRLLHLALQHCQREVPAEVLCGPTALAFGSDDPTAPAKVLLEFSRDYPVCELKAAMLGNQMISPSELAKLPSRTDLLGQLVGLLSTPFALLQTLGSSAVGTILALQAQQEREGAAA